MRKIDGFILAGGESRRMGRPKSNLRLGGLSLIERAVNSLQEVCDRVFIVGQHESKHRFQTLQDFESSHTPKRRAAIVGLYTALLNCRASRAAVLACDLPFVTSQVFERLAEISLTSPASDVVVPVQPDGRLQPLCAVYRPDACLPIVRSALESGDLRLRETVGRFNMRRVEFQEIADLTGSENFFLNLNTPRDYEAAIETAGKLHDVPGPD